MLVRGPVAHAALDAPAGHPESEAGGIMVPSIGLLDVGRSPELATPDDECVLEEVPLLQVGQKGRQGPVGSHTIIPELFLEGAVLVPGGMSDLHEADPFLH